IAYQVANVGDDPLCTSLDELVIVELCQVLFKYGDLFSNDLQERLLGKLYCAIVSFLLRIAERETIFDLLQIANSIHCRQQVIEGFQVETHSITSRLSKG